jgi:N-acetylneuraminic acid mutarotase
MRWLITLAVIALLPATAFGQTPSWSSVGSSVFARNAATAVTSSGVLYTVGMTSSGSTFEAYNPATNSWSLKASFGPLAADVNGTMYAAFVNQGDNSAMLSKYNAASNSWTAVSNSPPGLAGSQMVAVGTELFFVARYGRPVQSAPFTIGLHVYDTVAGTWTVEVGQFQGADEYADSTAVVVNGKIYFVGGKPVAINIPQSRVVQYDPSTGVWTQKADLASPVARAGATALNGKLYVVGGYSGTGTVKATTQVYDPASNSWSLLPDMPTARYGLGFAALGNDLYAVDGFNGTVGLNTVEKLTLPVVSAYYRIKNRWQSTYLHTENLTGSVQVGSINPSWLSAQWSIEDSGQGYVRLKNRWTGKYMHTENLTGKVQYGDILPQWDSAKWFLDNFNGYKRIRNLWTNKFVHIENLTGFAQYGSVFDTWESAQWTLEAVQ